MTQDDDEPGEDDPESDGDGDGAGEPRRGHLPLRERGGRRKRRSDDEAVRVLHRGRGYAVISKPAGLSVVAERNRPGETPLLEAIGRALGVEQVLVVHRLDRETTGCMIVATEPDAHRHLSELFRKRKVRKTYLALVRGAAPSEGEVAAPLEPDPRSGSFMRVARRSEPGHRKRPKRARTRYRGLVGFKGMSLLAVEPVTGRQHQIRVHMQYAGHPLVVDPAYGGAAGLFLSELKRGYRPSHRKPELPIIDRVTLHAWKLAFTDPEGQLVQVRAPLPQDLRRALKELMRHAAPKAAQGRHA